MEILEPSLIGLPGSGKLYAETGSNKYEDNVLNEKSETSIVALRFPGGVVMAADSNTTQGIISSTRSKRKVIMLHHRIAVSQSGRAAHLSALRKIVAVQLQQHSQELNSPGGYLRGGNEKQQLEKELVDGRVKRPLTERLPTVLTAATLMKNLAYNYRDQLSCSHIIAGWDPKRGGQIFSVANGGFCTSEHYVAHGSGSPYMISFLDSHYKTNEQPTKEECQEMAKQAVQLAISRDGGSGGLIRVVTIEEDNVEETVTIADPAAPVAFPSAAIFA